MAAVPVGLVEREEKGGLETGGAGGGAPEVACHFVDHGEGPTANGLASLPGVAEEVVLELAGGPFGVGAD